MKPQPPPDKATLLARARLLTGITLQQLANQLEVTTPTEMVHAKGWAGKLLELALGANAKNTPQPDFTALNIELKTIPIGPSGRPQESTYICAVQLEQKKLRHWDSSLVKHKLTEVLWIPIEATKTTPIGQRRIGHPVLWRASRTQEQQLKTDWQELTDMIAIGELDKISATMGEYLQIRPKAENARSLMTANSQLDSKTLPRGFYLRPVLTTAILATGG